MSLKELEDTKKEWERRNKVRIDYETELREKFKSHLNRYLNKAISEFIEYFKNEGYDVKKIFENFIEANYGNLKFQLRYQEPNPGPYLIFAFAKKITTVRTEYQVVIQFVEEYYYPKIALFRTCPEDKEQILANSKKMDEEMLIMQNLIKNSDKMKLTYSYYRIDNSKPEFRKMKRFFSFKEIINEIEENG